jgi:hypothetical protein
MYSANPATSSEAAFGFSARAYSMQYLKGLYAKPGAWKHMLNVTSDAAFGESVSMAILPAVTAQDVTVSTGAFTYDNTSVTQGVVRMDKIKAVPFSVPEYTMIQAKVDMKALLMENAAGSINDSIDAEMVELIASLSTNSAGSANADLTEDYVYAALAALVGQNVPVSNPMDLAWILPGSQFGPVHKLKGYTSYRIWNGPADAEGSNDVKPNITTLLGIDVFFRNDSGLTVTSGKIGGLFHRDSVGVAIQKSPTTRMSPIDGTVNTELLTYAIFGINLLDEKRACKVLCK